MVPEFPFESEDEKNALMKQTGGNPLTRILAHEDLDADLVVSRLKPYRCAVVDRDTSFKGPSARQEKVMTTQDIGCHLYPQEGMYTIIDGHVYDLSGKIIHDILLYSASSKKILRLPSFPPRRQLLAGAMGWQELYRSVQTVPSGLGTLSGPL